MAPNIDVSYSAAVFLGLVVIIYRVHIIFISGKLQLRLSLELGNELSELMTRMESFISETTDRNQSLILSTNLHVPEVFA